MQDSELTDVIIIGAGPAGLAAGACLNRLKIKNLILEKNDTAGSAWKKHYDRLHLHTIKSLSSLPFLPFPEEYPRYVSRQQFADYLERYAIQFSPDIRFGEEVLSLTYEPGVWKIKTKKKEFLAKKIIVSTGYNHSPIIPHWEGQEKFQGEIIHSRDYRNGKSFTGKKVLVVGAGNTGGEIAIDLWENGANTFMSIRGPLRVVPRDPFGIPMQISATLLNLIPNRIADLISRVIGKITVEDLTPFGIRTPDFGSVRQVKDMEKIPLIDIGTIDLIRQGAIKVLPGIEKFNANTILFTDGREIEIDSVILATGYSPRIDLFLSNHKSVLNERGTPIAKGKESSVPGLYFLGFNNHISGFLRRIGVEAKMIAKDIRKKLNARK